MIKDITQKIFFILPLLLWPLAFILFAPIFLYAMVLVTIFLGLSTLLLFRENLRFLLSKSKFETILKNTIISLIASMLLYLIFLLGGKISYQIGIGYLVLNIYNMLLNINKISLGIALIVIGIMEEIYWRGFIQNTFTDTQYPWLFSSIYYSIVHAVTLNYVLTIAALIVGLITGYIAYKFGIAYSIITHITWLEITIVILPILP